MKRIFAVFGLICAFSLAGAVFNVPTASAVVLPRDCGYPLQPNNGRCVNEGYFSPDPVDYFDTVFYPFGGRDFVLPPTDFTYFQPGRSAVDDHWAFPQSTQANDLASVNNWMNYIGGILFQPINIPVDCAFFGVCNPKIQRINGAAYIIDNMLGKPGTDWDTPNAFGETGLVAGQRFARDNYGAWRTQVLSYWNRGALNMNDHRFVPSPHLNSSSVGYHRDSAVFVFSAPAFEEMNAIVFTNASGGEMVINRFCANNIGRWPGPEDYHVDIDPAANGPVKIAPGSTASARVTLHSNGPAFTEAGTTRVFAPAGITAAPGQTGMTLFQIPGQFGFTGAAGPPFSTPGHVGANAGPNWFWQTGIMQPGTDPVAGFQFSVPANASPGFITFWACYYKPSGFAAAPLCKPLVYQVQIVSFPSVVADSGDIHAGGGICALSSGSGYVQGNPSSNSGGQYVVSASAGNGITNFNSNGSGTPDDLKLGRFGNYAQVCRPDLLAAAKAYQLAGGGITINPAITDWDLNAHTGGVYFYAGANLNVHGNVHEKTTIVALSGKITVINPGISILPASRARTDTPSLGIIANGNIEISGKVNQVDAYMFSNAAINTCVAPLGPTGCSSTLLVNGFLMAKSMTLGRLGPFNAQGVQSGEHIVLNPQIYLNPPALFDASIDDNLLEGNGERPPLF